MTNSDLVIPVGLPEASWIWSDADPAAGGQFVCFRLLFTSAGPATWIGFADTTYTISCNGQVLGVGPVTGMHTMPRLTAWDLTPFLRSRENELQVEVWFDGRLSFMSDVDTWQAGVLGWLITPEATVPTGPAWQAQTVAECTMAHPEHRAFGAKRVVIADLRAATEHWTPAIPVAAHPASARPTLRMSPIPPLTQRILRPATLFDAGIAAGDLLVETADQVAERMIAQSHTSLIRPQSVMSVLSVDEQQAPAVGLPQSTRMQALGWPDQTDGFHGPLGMPAVAGEFFCCWDMGVQTSGNVWLEIETTQDTVIDLGYADHLQRGRVNPTLQGHSYADRLIVGPGRQTVHVPHDRGFRYLQCTFAGPVVLHDLWVAEHVYPHDDILRFHSSDATLNAIWDMARATLHQCTLTSHVDNARRERQGWSGPDLYAQLHGFLHAFGDPRLSRKMLVDFLDFFDQEGFIPNWAPAIAPAVKWISAHDLWFPITAWDYLCYTDDRTLAPRLLRAADAVMAYYGQQVVDGLLGRAHAGACRWAEWSMNAAQQCSTWENLLAVVAWRAIAALREYLGVPGGAEAQCAATQLTAAINARLWHPRHQALAQGTDDSGELLDFCGQVDNAFALLHDILLDDRRAAAYRWCAGPSGTWPTAHSGWQGHGQGERSRYDPRKAVVTGTPFGSSLCAQAMHHRGAHYEAVQYIRYNFGAMLDEGEGTLWEMWPIYQQENTAATCFSQGYGGHITATLIQCLVGLRITAPGGTRLRWRPVPNGVAWVEAVLDTLHGAVWVRRDAAGLHYRVPAGVVLEIEHGEAVVCVQGPIANTLALHDA